MAGQEKERKKERKKERERKNVPTFSKLLELKEFDTVLCSVRDMI